MYKDASSLDKELEIIKLQKEYLKTLPFKVGDEVCFKKNLKKKMVITKVMIPVTGAGNAYYIVNNLDTDYPVYPSALVKWTELQEKLYE